MFVHKCMHMLHAQQIIVYIHAQHVHAHAHVSMHVHVCRSHLHAQRELLGFGAAEVGKGSEREDVERSREEEYWERQQCEAEVHLNARRAGWAHVM